MESRKRPHAQEEEPTITKKRIVSAANGSPRVNGTSVEPEEPDLGRNLESFRKEAIYRRMKYYSRENDRNLARIAELERRKNTCEAGLTAISACWSQLVEAIRLLMKPEDLPEVSIGTQDIFDLTAHLRSEETNDIASALRNKFKATQSLVTKFAQLNGTKLGAIDTYVECQRAQTECAALRSQLDMLRARLQESDALKEQYYTALVAAENRVERTRSSTVKEMEGRAATEKVDTKSDGSEESQRKPSSPAHTTNSPVQVDGNDLSANVEVLQQLVNNRDAKIVELEKEATLLHDQIVMKDVQLKSPAVEQVIEHPAYKAMQEREDILQKTLMEKEEQISHLTGELNQLQATKKEREESIQSAFNQSLQDLKTMLSKRDIDNTRLRDQREQLTAEILERKQRESIKQSSLQEYRNLAESRSERILALESEVKRLKSRLAAEARDEDLMSFIFSENGDMSSNAYVDSLKSRALAAESRVAALEEMLAMLQGDQSDVVQHMKAEANTRQKLSEVTAELERYQRIYGNSSSLPPDVSQLAEQLQQKENELQQLRLVNTQKSQAEMSLFAELEKLSTSWEALDRQVQSKVFDLSQLEERLTKSGLDKAKSDNKFFAAMRDKEAVEVERKNLSRNMEKQAKTVERLVNIERNLLNQVSDLEKEVTSLKKGHDLLKRDNLKLTMEASELRSQAEYERKEKEAARASINEREDRLSAFTARLRVMEDGLVRAKKEVEQQALEWKRVATNSSQNKNDGEVQSLKELLRCSTCKTHFRNTVITKCMHTFCKQCVESRIATRQRKCPACNILFAQSDVQTLWFQ
ncbi:hypothetical protein AX17_004001 [Amanita inopinata Kibby_2008]|nr:hypothetical protein AX17_004001 [Amanita inopinata Kibby_2008]